MSNPTRYIRCRTRPKTFRIEKGVPFPPSIQMGDIFLPFADMKPGDSFLVSKPSAYELTNIRLKTSHANRDSNKRFVTRTIEDGARERSVRIWRVK